jgi:hypothetical protein
MSIFLLVDIDWSYLPFNSSFLGFKYFELEHITISTRISLLSFLHWHFY